MLPTKGYFKDIDCPYHERTCGRPYCHFRHRKKAPDAEDAPAVAEGVLTYKPTPKSELAVGKQGHALHIPISYVPDVVRASTRKSYSVAERPTYKPTPKSVLSGATRSTANDASSAACANTYTPTPIEQLKDQASTELNFEEMQLIDEILSEALATDGVLQESDLKSIEPEKEVCDISKSTQEKSNEIIAALTATTESKKDKSHKKHRSKDDKPKDRHRDKNKDKDKDRKRERHKSDKETKSSKTSALPKSQKGEKVVKKSSSSSKSKHSSDKERVHKKDHKSSSSKSKHTSSSESKQKVEKLVKIDESKAQVNDADLSTLEDDLCALNDSGDDNDVDFMMIEDECFKIFNEYKAPVPEVAAPLEPLKVIVPEDELKEEAYPVGKKRIAYTNATKDEQRSKPAFKPLLSAGMTLQNRMRIARQAQAANEATSIMTAVQDMKRPVTSMPITPDAKRVKLNGLARGIDLKPKATPSPSTSLIDDILNAKSTTTVGVIPKAPPLRRIAPASNVLSIQMAKARIDEIKNRTLSATAARQDRTTLATTGAKGAPRCAHVPDMSLHNIPDVLHAERSKLAVNVRTRYLGLLADECLKLYVATEEAYARALNEEFKCYERCKALPTYRNSAMLAVNRLRKEALEREAAGLGPLQVGEAPAHAKQSALEGRRFYELVKGFALSEDELVLHGFPREGPTPGRAVIAGGGSTSEHLAASQRLCCRCHKVYHVNRDGFPLIAEECCYHPLRKRTIRGERTYLCCKSTEDTGCAVSGTHVSEVSADRELEGFQSTFASEAADDPRDFAVYALDCEMCYTTKGLELTRVTVVNSQLKTVYESLVKPFNPIIDYNTRFSGITAEHLASTTTNILQIQATILHLCSSKTILIGHSLESDMKALKIIHNSIVDTSVMFPHKFGLPHKRALRVLCSEYLQKIIQNDVAGHDSAEDALAAMELVLWKVKEDLKVKGIKS